MKRILFVVCLLLSRTHTWSSERVESKDLTGHVDFQPGTPQDSLSVLLITMEEAGHSIPMLSLGEALVEKGHKVTLLAVETKLPASNSTMTNLRAWCRERSILCKCWRCYMECTNKGGRLRRRFAETHVFYGENYRFI